MQSVPGRKDGCGDFMIIISMLRSLLSRNQNQQQLDPNEGLVREIGSASVGWNTF
jgi:hypothetical protein